MEIMYLPTGELKPYPKNAKRHPPEQVEHIANSIRAFGFRQPIVIDADNVVVIGHGRLMAAKKLGMDSVPCIRADDLTEAQIAALRLADNKTNESEWDFSLLESELDDLKLDFNMEDFGFDEPGEALKMEDVQEDDPDLTPPEKPITILGDIWQLGRHRLMCGSSTDEDNIAELMDGKRAAILFTSPPYSDMREYEGGKDLSVENLAQFIAKYRPYTDYQCVNLGIQRKNNDIYEYWDEYIRVARENGYKMLSWNVWDKGLTGNIGQARAFFPLRHEFIFVFGTDFYEINFTVEKKPESIVKHMKPKTKRNTDGSMEYHSTGDTSKPYKQMESVLFLHPELSNSIRKSHPATFPVGLPGEYIKAMTQKGDIVIEPFGGSGTTLIACEQLDRQCCIMELEPKYCDVIVRRWEEFTGKKAVRLTR